MATWANNFNFGGSPGGGGYNFSMGGGGYGGGGRVRQSTRYQQQGQGQMPGYPPMAPQPQMPYQPMGPQVQGLINPLAQAGQGLLDPGSDYSKRMRTELSENIGEQTEAQQRAAALRAARSGLGAGASPELLETQGDIGRSGLEAYGDASAQSMLGGMELGGRLMNPALQGQLGLQGQQQTAYLAQQAQNQDAEMARFQAAMQQQQMAQDAMLRQMAMMYGMFQ